MGKPTDYDYSVEVKNTLVRHLKAVLTTLKDGKVDMACDAELRKAVDSHLALELSCNAKVRKAVDSHMVLDVYGMTDQPEQCSQCGGRTDFIESNIGQIHACLACKYTFILEE